MVSSRDEAARWWGRLLVEPRRPAAVRNSPRAAWLAVGTVCIGAFMGQFDASIVTLAFPTLRHDFHASLASVQWVGQAYLLVLIALLPAVGRYADMVGRKLLYANGFIIFVIGSALCGIAPTLPALIALRVLQGFGAAMFQANSVAIIVSAVPKDCLGRAIGIQGAAQALGLAVGPAAGGLLIGLGGWRLIFLVNVPIGIIGTVLAWLFIPRSRDLTGPAPFDWTGLALFAPAATALLLAVSYGNRQGWASPFIVALFAVAAIFSITFVKHEHRMSAPMLDLGVFARLSFSAGIASGLLSYLVLFGVLTVGPFFLEIAQHASPGHAGVELLALPIGLGLTAPLAGRLAERIGTKPLTVGGMLVVAGGLTVSATVGSHLIPYLAALAATGIGLGAFTPANNAAIMASVPPSQTGIASGVLNMTRGLGTSFGLALASLAFTVGAGSQKVTRDSSVVGYRDAAVFLAAAAVVAALRPRRHEPAKTGSVPTDDPP